MSIQRIVILWVSSLSTQLSSKEFSYIHQIFPTVLLTTFPLAVFSFSSLANVPMALHFVAEPHQHSHYLAPRSQTYQCSPWEGTMSLFFGQSLLSSSTAPLACLVLGLSVYKLIDQNPSHTINSRLKRVFNCVPKYPQAKDPHNAEEFLVDLQLYTLAFNQQNDPFYTLHIFI